MCIYHSGGTQQHFHFCDLEFVLLYIRLLYIVWNSQQGIWLLEPSATRSWPDLRVIKALMQLHLCSGGHGRPSEY